MESEDWYEVRIFKYIQIHTEINVDTYVCMGLYAHMSQNTKTILEFKKKKGSRMNIQSKRPYLDTESGWLNSSLTAMLLSSKLGISTAFNEDALPGGLVTSLLISTEKFMSSLEILVSSCFS